MAPVNFECITRKNLPSIQLALSVDETFPPGPNGPGFKSPSEIQLPARYSSLASSGAGFGMGICAMTATPKNVTTSRQARDKLVRRMGNRSFGGLVLWWEPERGL